MYHNGYLILTFQAESTIDSVTIQQCCDGNYESTDFTIYTLDSDGATWISQGEYVEDPPKNNFDIHFAAPVTTTAVKVVVGSGGSISGSDNWYRVTEVSVWGCDASAATTECLPFECTCANGVAKTGADCTTHGASMCESCSAGYTMNTGGTACEGFACIGVCMYGCMHPSMHCTAPLTVCQHAVANACTCTNGVAKTGADCTTDGASMCASCSAGYTINEAATGCTGLDVFIPPSTAP